MAWDMEDKPRVCGIFPSDQEYELTTTMTSVPHHASHQPIMRLRDSVPISAKAPQFALTPANHICITEGSLRNDN